MKSKPMALCLVAVAASVLCWFSRSDAKREGGGPESCSTFMLAADKALVVGHNLDEGFDTVGQVVVNKRGVEKQNVSWADLKFWGSWNVPRIRWISKHGSITYNTIGREFIDGGLNEAGLYVGEKTLLGSKYPPDPKLPKIYHHHWMQYLLDNFETVPQVLESMNSAILDGHCQWHFFVADKSGDAATIEFLNGKAVIHRGAGMPYKVLGNLSYDDEMKALPEYEGFGGKKNVAFKDMENGRRFVWGATMIRDYGTTSPDQAIPYAFSVLKQLDKGATKWSLVYDLMAMKLYWRTNKSPDVRFADFTDFDFSCSTPALVLDIHENFSGNAAKRFRPYTDAENAQAVAQALKAWDMGAIGNTFLKPRMVDMMSKAPGTFTCKP
jgi:penicillin V acylase-like amidase (Ntn superfamily)